MTNDVLSWRPAQDIIKAPGSGTSAEADGGLEPGGAMLDSSLELSWTEAWGSYGGLEPGGAMVDWSLKELLWAGVWRSYGGLEPGDMVD